jgi:hypothetical protein
MDQEPANRDPIAMESIHLSPRELYILMTSIEKVLTLRANMEEKARQLQAVEYERRLEVLNNDREEARQKESNFVLRVQHDDMEKRVSANNLAVNSIMPISARVDALYLWRDEITKVMAALQSRLASMIAYGAGMGLALTIAMFVINKIWK